ncbi:hypothetical protein TrST_g7271 [Triparma strigata]|uniref:Uncharacterized protein n=1 Tax=Triparma strigata TaxID=1606541 RepID=A0A9W7E6G0_9STRA|nr:hypothetical protein TrST_g7271 [Triparma strigata]
MVKSGSSIKHFKKRASAKSAVKSSQIRSYKKALKQSGYEDDKPRGGVVRSEEQKKKKKKTTGFENIKSKKDAKKEEEQKNQARIAESQKRRASEKRTYARSKGKGKSGGGKLNLISKVLLGRIEKRLGDDKISDKKK